jgi:hypothetical protein
MALLVQEPFLSIIGGGLAAALVSIGFNVWWDCQKQKNTEDWEFRRYHANLIHFSTAGIIEAFFSAKAELYYLTASLESLLGNLNRLTAQADQIVKQQGGPDLTVALLELKKEQLLQPFRNFNQEQVNLRWNQYEQKAKDNHAKAEVHLATLKLLIPTELHTELTLLFTKLSAPFIWDLPNGREKLKLLEESEPEVLVLRNKLMRQLEVRLGRTS